MSPFALEARVSPAVAQAVRRFYEALRYEFWVIPYEVSRFPGDVQTSYRVVDARHYPAYPGACRHTVQVDRYQAARAAAIAQHRDGLGCGGQP